jgi:hypothetical protein
MKKISFLDVFMEKLGPFLWLMAALVCCRVFGLTLASYSTTYGDYAAFRLLVWCVKPRDWISPWLAFVLMFASHLVFVGIEYLGRLAARYNEDQA